MKGLQIIDMFSVHFVDDASLDAHYQDPKRHMHPIPGIYAINYYNDINDIIIIKLNITKAFILYLRGNLIFLQGNKYRFTFWMFL